jgi:Tol biopolymer transport system component
VIAAVLAAWMFVRPSSTAAPVARFQVAFEGPVSTLGMFFGVSPDGKTIAYSTDRIWLRSLSQEAAQTVPGTEKLGAGFISHVVFSPDGQSIAFWYGADASKGELRKVAVSGGAVTTIASASYPFGMTWGADGIVYGQLISNSGIYRVSAEGGAPELLVKAADGEATIEPQLLPDGDSLLFTAATGFDPNTAPMAYWDKAQIVVQSLRTGERRVLIKGGSAARYASPGVLFYAVANTVMAVPLDARRRAITGQPRVLLDYVARPIVGGLALGSALFSVSDAGSLLYVSQPPSMAASVRLAIASIGAKALEPLPLAPAPYVSVRVSPEGKRIVYATGVADGSLWTYDLSAGTSPLRIAFGGYAGYPIWTPDGRRLTYASSRDGKLGIWWQAADGSGTPERLTPRADGSDLTALQMPNSWSPDGTTLLFTTMGTRGAALQMLSVPDKRISVFGEVVSSASFQPQAVFSPDGHWVAYAYVSESAGIPQVFVEPFPPTGAKFQVSEPSTPAVVPRWARDGKSLYYVTAGEKGPVFNRVAISTRPTFTLASHQTSPMPFAAFNGVDYDVMPDGRLLTLANDSTVAGDVRPNPPIHVLLNWPEELRARSLAALH